LVISKSTFTSHLKQPDRIGSESIVAMAEVVKDYPYFQSAQMLLTKAYHTSENLNFESSLKKTAAYAANRTHLHQLLFSTSTFSNPIEEVQNEEPSSQILEESAPQPEVNPLESIPTEITELPTPEEPVMTTIPAAEAEEVLKDKLEEPLLDEESIAKLPIEEKPVILNEDKFSIDFSKIEESKKDELDALENQILSAAVSNSILHNVSDEIPDLDALSSQSANQEHVQISKPFEFNAEKAKKIPEDHGDHNYSFSDWLRVLDNPENDEIEVGEDEEFQPESSTNLSVIKEDREKASFYSPVKMARLSVQEDDDLMTETLANIYADQGHLEKAIIAFEKLQLKYPEKSSYFAARINEIKNQLNT